MIAVVPMAGGEDTFRERGYGYCKALIEVHGKPLCQHVLENLRSLQVDTFVFVIRREDSQRFHVDEVLRLMEPNAKIIQTNAPTAGAVCTALLAIEHIAAEEELVVANGDQLLLTDLAQAVRGFREQGLDGGTLVFDSVHPRWSFVLTDENGLIIEAAEKRPISRLATAGFYYFRRGKDFVNGAFEMIRKDANTNGQFYICPVFNELILGQKRLGVHSIDRAAYWSLATPQNVEEYEQFLAKQP